jgi:hypothetical protein
MSNGVDSMDVDAQYSDSVGADARRQAGGDTDAELRRERMRSMSAHNVLSYEAAMYGEQVYLTYVVGGCVMRAVLKVVRVCAFG